MRLINTESLELHEFFTEQAPEKYAILSHCWGADEVSFAEFTNGSKKRGYGYQKILDCCKLAREQGLEWAWVDTCCINKTSSAELSEAINSMFAWYKRSTVCYVFLPDYKNTRPISRTGEEQHISAADQVGPTPTNDLWFELSQSRWFQRGWTLQELLAPVNVLFYDQDGVQFGTKVGLSPALSTITKIDEPYLKGDISISSASVACRMSWASDRITTRTEDMAYCLLGIFDVNMPLLYGEGYKAFSRLQENILQQSADDSIFAWTSGESADDECPRGLLAVSPREFARSGDIVRHDFFIIHRGGDPPPYRLTNKGIELPLVQVPELADLLQQILVSSTWLSARSFELSCRRRSQPNRLLTITIQKHRSRYQPFRKVRYLRVAHTALERAATIDFIWSVISTNYTNYYVVPHFNPGTAEYTEYTRLFVPRPLASPLRRLVGLLARLLFSILLAIFASLANWKYDNPMFITGIILLGLPKGFSGHLRIVFVLVLVLSGNFGIGPSFPATKRQH